MIRSARNSIGTLNSKSPNEKQKHTNTREKKASKFSILWTENCNFLGPSISPINAGIFHHNLSQDDANTERHNYSGHE
jgi:hypothetical protein